MPKVSVIIPTYQTGHMVRQAVASVLMQTYEDMECIVVDDGSTDDTEAKLASITDSRLRYVKQPNQGVSAARNLGLNRARGSYIAFLDADDLWRPDYLRRQIKILGAEPGVGLSFTDFIRSHEGGIFPQTYMDFMPELFKAKVGRVQEGFVLADDPFTTLISFQFQPIQLQTLVVRREIVNGNRRQLPIRFNLKRRTGEDREFVIRCWLRCPQVSFIDEPLAEVRRHGSNTYRPGMQSGSSVLQALRDEPMTYAQKRALLKRIAQAHCGAAYQARKRKDRASAAKSYIRALWYPGRRWAALGRLVILPLT